MQNWIGNAYAKMRVNHITQKQLAEKVGVTKDWISLIFLGKASASEQMKNRIITAIEELVTERSS